MKLQEKTLYLVIIVLLISVGALGWLYKGKSDAVDEKDSIIYALNDTLQITRNEKGEQVVKISTFETNKVKDFLKIQNLEGVNKQLQDAVRNTEDRLGDRGSVTVFSTSTSVNASVPTKVITFKDTVRVNDTIKVFPEYAADVNLGRWINAKITSNRDSTRLNLGVINEYSLVIGEDPIKGTGFLGIGKKFRPFSEVTNHNPYSTTPTLRTYQVRSAIKPKRISLGIQAGYGLKGEYIGVGIQYNLLNLW